jgi:hypothetical protein
VQADSTSAEVSRLALRPFRAAAYSASQLYTPADHDCMVRFMKTDDFWKFFNTVAAPRLELREKTFRKIFEYLDVIEGPLTIVETGCVRLEDNWEGDGQSTIMFDKYINYRDQDSICYTVDISPAAVLECKRLVSSRVQVNTDDSVHFLRGLSEKLKMEKKFINFAYLDSFDVDMTYWHRAAIHHLKELLAISNCINNTTLVAVDDSPLNANFIDGEASRVIFGIPSVGGKGRLIAEFAAASGAKVEFTGYQAGWTGF